MRISVFITSYNQKRFLIEAIESVLNQTVKPFEIIVVDDCSTDGSRELIAAYASRYTELLVPIYHTRNKGVTQSRIDALCAVTGDYVTYVDGDDRFLPSKLEEEAEALRATPSAKIAFSNNYYMSEDGARIWIWADGEKPPEGDVFRQTFAREFPRRSLFRMELVEYKAWKRVGFHDPNLALYEDFDMRIRLTKHYHVVYRDMPLSEIRTNNSGLSSSAVSQHLTALEYIYRKNRPLLNDLSIPQRKDVKRKLRNWMARIARRGAMELLDQRQFLFQSRVDAFKCTLQALKYEPTRFDCKLLLKLLLSHRADAWLGRAIRGAQDNGTRP